MSSIKTIAKNKRAFYDYAILDTYEAGLCLMGTEVKGLRTGKTQLTEAFVMMSSRGEAWVHNMRIPHYQFGNRHNHPEMRKRKLLLHRKELEQIRERMQRENLNLIPLKIYFKRSHVKMEIALAKGKKQYDKRESLKAREAKKETRQPMRYS